MEKFAESGKVLALPSEGAFSLAEVVGEGSGTGVVVGGADCGSGGVGALSMRVMAVWGMGSSVGH